MIFMRSYNPHIKNKRFSPIRDLQYINVGRGRPTYIAPKPMSLEHKKQIEQFMPIWTFQIKRNIQKNIFKLRCGRHDLAELDRDTWSDKCVTIIGAGPSLKSEIENISNETILVVVDRALEYCLDNDIHPDWVVSCDPQLHVGEFWHNLYTKNLKLIAPISIANEALFHWHGQIYFYCDPPYNHLGMQLLQKATGIKGFLSPGGTVGATAIAFAYRFLWPAAIFMVGMDYSWKEKFYADEKYEDRFKLDDAVEVEDVYGETVRTFSPFQRSVESIHHLIHTAIQNDVKNISRQDAKAQRGDENKNKITRFYNCSGGIISEHVIISNLKDAYKKEGISNGDPGF